jgi:hypothetical protein
MWGPFLSFRSAAVDLGSSTSFQRLVVNPSTLLGLLQSVQLQSSDDGVKFTDIRSVGLPGSVRTFLFKAVSARYLRVSLRSIPGVEINVREVGVYPQ